MLWQSNRWHSIAFYWLGLFVLHRIAPSLRITSLRITAHCFGINSNQFGFFSPYHTKRSKTQKFTNKIAESLARSGIQTFLGILFVAIESPTKSPFKNYFKFFLCAESLTAIGFWWIGTNFFLWKRIFL